MEFKLGIEEVKKALVIYLYLKGEISLGKLAELLNISKVEAIELLSKLGISVINYPSEELEEELSLAKSRAL